MARQIDVDRFEPVMAESRIAFAIDSAYAVAMCHAASQILYKRRLWVVRKELRAASAAAVEACATQSFTCATASPCGTGSCRWATGDLALLDLPERPGKSARPQPRPGHSSYDIEHAHRPLLALRDGSAQSV